MFSKVSGKVLHEFSCWWFAPGPFSVNCRHLFLEELWTRFWQVVTSLRTVDRALSICTDSDLTTSKEKEMRELSWVLCRIHQQFINSNDLKGKGLTFGWAKNSSGHSFLLVWISSRIRISGRYWSIETSEWSVAGAKESLDDDLILVRLFPRLLSSVSK